MDGSKQQGTIMCNLSEQLEQDFIEALTEHSGYSPDQAIDAWNKHGEQYLDDIFEQISNSIVNIVNRDTRWRNCSILNS